MKTLVSWVPPGGGRLPGNATAGREAFMLLARTAANCKARRGRPKIGATCSIFVPRDRTVATRAALAVTGPILVACAPQGGRTMNRAMAGWAIALLAACGGSANGGGTATA